jgi:minor extracellular serine protease Vpr
MALIPLLALLSPAGPGAGPPTRADDVGSPRPGWEKKLDPFLRRIALGSFKVQGRFKEPIPPRSNQAARALPSFVLVDRRAPEPILNVKARIVAEDPGGNKEWNRIGRVLEEMGVEVRARLGSMVSLRVPAAALQGLADRPEVLWLKAARGYRLENEVSTGSALVASDEANVTFNTRGAGVIVGVMDTGIEWQNHDFRHTDGTTRILGIWDQTLSDPLHPPPTHISPGFSFGAYYDASDIDAAIASGGSLMTGDGHGHGTHVAGSAAGNGLETGRGIPAGTFAGVAPEADLLVVRVFDNQGVFCFDCDLTAAVQFIRQVAASEGKPWVGNMSLATDLGAHDGSDPDELSIDEAVGPARPGAQVAIAAGNSGGLRIHWEGTLSPGAVFTNTFNPSYVAKSGADNDFIWMDAWYEGADAATFEIVTPGGTTVTAARGTDSGIVCTTSGAVEIDATNAPDPANGDNEVFVQIWDSSVCSPVINPGTGTWTIRIRANSVVSPVPSFDLWDEADLGALARVDLSSFTLDESVGVPGTSRQAITAAAYVNKSQWINVNGTTTNGGGIAGDIAGFSAIGPTRDDRLKPDIAAPGQNVGSSLAESVRPGLNPILIERDGEHRVLSGTSMATPHVAGVAALLLALGPGLTGPEIKAAMQRSARSDSFTGPVPNARFGHGKLRAPEAAGQAVTIVADFRAISASGFTATDNPFVDSYNVYRGTIPGISATNYGSCFTSGLLSPTFDDLSTPIAGRAFFYLAAGVRGGIEGILGIDSLGRIRPNNFPCP